MSKYKFNIFTGTLDLVNDQSGSTIPELTSDPVSPASEDAWMLYTAKTGGGKLQFQFGGGMAITTPAAGSSSYQFSYKTKEGTIIRTALT